jgi:hypothetical protein
MSALTINSSRVQGHSTTHQNINMPLEESLQSIEDNLLPQHRKWGWIVYRTTYGNGEQWTQCIEAFQRLVREITLMKEGGEEHAARYLDFPVRNDPEVFNDASSTQLRSHFKTWRNSDEAFEEQQIDRSQREELWESMRYRYFIRVGAEAMQSVLDAANGRTSSSRAWVDLVQVDWPDRESDEDEDEDEDEGEEEPADHGSTDGFPPIEGMTTYEVGFQRVPIVELYPTCWMDKETIPEKWYTRPPKLTYDIS